MEYSFIERSTDELQQAITREQLIAMCQRAFGEEIQITSANELDGGLYNNTYLIRIIGMPPVILRVSPHASRQPCSDRNLMRNEYASYPFLIPIMSLLPRILMADFTHQILERDYMFQTFMEGEQWAKIQNTFTSEKKKDLWRQLGSIVKKIHAVRGETFGRPALDLSYSSWSQVVIGWLTDIIEDLERVPLETSDVKMVLAFAQTHRALLDEITQPRLLHGDLWLVNILIKREEEGPKIVAVLDSDRTAWGDPMADWTMTLLRIHAGSEADAFWETYGLPEKSLAAQFRALIYHSRFQAGARLEQYRLGNYENIQRTRRDMYTIIKELQRLPLTHHP